MAIAESLYEAELRLARYYASKLHQIYDQYRNGGASMTAALLNFDREWAQIRHWQGRVAAATVDKRADNIDFTRLMVEFARYMLSARQTFAENQQWLQLGLDAAQRLGDHAKEAFMLQELCFIALERGERDKSRTYADQSLEAALKSGDGTSIMWSQIRVANAATWMGDLDIAETACQEAFASIAVDRDAKIIIYNIRSLIAMYRGEFARAIEFTDKMIELIYQQGNLQRLAIAFHSLATYYFMLGDLERADYHLSESLRIVRYIGDRKGLPNGLMMHALIAIERGHLTDAYTYSIEQESVAREVDSPRMIIIAQSQYGVIEHLRGNYPEARKYYDTALASVRQLGNLGVECDTLLGLTRLAIDSGDYSEAAEYCHQMLVEDVVSRMDPTAIWIPHLGLGQIAHANGEYAQALTHFQEALPYAQDVNTSLVDIYAAIASTHLHMGNLAEAQQSIQRAEDVQNISPKHQIPRITTIRALQAKVYLSEGKIQHAHDTLLSALQSGQQLELILPRIHLIEAAAEYLAAISDIRCMIMFSLVAHHPASEMTMRKAMELRRDALAAVFDADKVNANWKQGKAVQLDALLEALNTDYLSDPRPLENTGKSETRN